MIFFSKPGCSDVLNGQFTILLFCLFTVKAKNVFKDSLDGDGIPTTILCWIQQ